MNTDLHADTRFGIPQNVYARRFGAETVLLDFGRGDYFGLDDIGTVLWNTVEGGGTIKDAVLAVVTSFDCSDKALVERDLLDLLRELVNAGLLEARSQ